MVNIKGADDNGAKLGLDSLTEEEATLFLKLVKLCKTKPQGASVIQQLASETPTTSESSSHDMASQKEAAGATVTPSQLSQEDQMPSHGFTSSIFSDPKLANSQAESADGYLSPQAAAPVAAFSPNVVLEDNLLAKSPMPSCHSADQSASIFAGNNSVFDANNQFE